jgi:hypothetical protein
MSSMRSAWSRMHGNPVEAQQPSPEQFEETSGNSDEHIGAARRLDLAGDADAAGDRHPSATGL